MLVVSNRDRLQIKIKTTL